MTVRDLFPLSTQHKQFIESVEEHLSPVQVKFLRKLLKNKWVGIHTTSFRTSEKLNCDVSFSQLSLAEEKPDIEQRIENINETLEEAAFEQARQAFSKHAYAAVTTSIAPHIVCDAAVKESCALQLFSTERFHILLIGDPGIGKTEIARSSSEFHPVHTFALGSSTSKAGLTVTAQGKTKTAGLLPEADEGICAIDELNLLPDKERGSLYNAMEKGFVTYRKGTSNVTLNARTRIVATANPKSDRFIGKDPAFLRQQIPFTDALLSRFHCVFILRLHSKEQLQKITRSIIENGDGKVHEADQAFIQRYVSSTESITVDFPKAFEEQIVEWSTAHKEKEKKLLLPVTPRTIVGVVRMAQAHARMHLRKEVTKEDLDVAFSVMDAALVPEFK